MVILMPGCSKPTAVVSGTLTYKSQPLTSGQIHFIGEDNKTRSSTINGDGTYRIEDAPVGKVKIAVVSLKHEGEGKLSPGFKILPKPVETVSAIPTKYGDPARSGLVYPVEARSQTIDIDLKD
jgi:hypothetical protein